MNMRYSGYVKILPKDKCLAIAKIIRSDEQNLTSDELLSFIPDDIFDSVYRIDSINNNIEVYDEEISDTYSWVIPFYFIERIVEREK